MVSQTVVHLLFKCSLAEAFFSAKNVDWLHLGWIEVYLNVILLGTEWR